MGQWVGNDGQENQKNDTKKKEEKAGKKNKKEEDESFLFDHDIEIGKKKITKKKGHREEAGTGKGGG